jgi:hypothetical protein
LIVGAKLGVTVGVKLGVSEGVIVGVIVGTGVMIGCTPMPGATYLTCANAVTGSPNRAAKSAPSQ